MFVPIFFVLYGLILLADFGGLSLHASWLKLAVVLLCLCQAKGRTKLALGLTFVCDVLLLFTSHFLAGVLCFCCVQFTYLSRFLTTKKRQLPAILAPVLSFFSLLWFSPLTAAGLSYAMLLGANVWAAFRLHQKERSRRSLLYFCGFLLFLGCDVCVGLFNTLLPSWSIGRFMWFFYAPSQFLLSFSSRMPEVPEPKPTPPQTRRLTDKR